MRVPVQLFEGIDLRAVHADSYGLSAANNCHAPYQRLVTRPGTRVVNTIPLSEPSLYPEGAHQPPVLEITCDDAGGPSAFPAVPSCAISFAGDVLYGGSAGSPSVPFIVAASKRTQEQRSLTLASGNYTVDCFGTWNGYVIAAGRLVGGNVKRVMFGSWLDATSDITFVNVNALATDTGSSSDRVLFCGALGEYFALVTEAKIVIYDTDYAVVFQFTADIRQAACDGEELWIRYVLAGACQVSRLSTELDLKTRPAPIVDDGTANVQDGYATSACLVPDYFVYLLRNADDATLTDIYVLDRTFEAEGYYRVHELAGTGIANPVTSSVVSQYGGIYLLQRDDSGATAYTWFFRSVEQLFQDTVNFFNAVPTLFLETGSDGLVPVLCSDGDGWYISAGQFGTLFMPYVACAATYSSVRNAAEVLFAPPYDYLIHAAQVLEVTENAATRLGEGDFYHNPYENAALVVTTNGKVLAATSESGLTLDGEPIPTEVWVEGTTPLLPSLLALALPQAPVAKQILQVGPVIAAINLENFTAEPVVAQEYRAATLRVSLPPPTDPQLQYNYYACWPRNYFWTFDEALIAGVVFAGKLYVFTQSRMYEVAFPGDWSGIADVFSVEFRYGCAAPHSLIEVEGALYWLSEAGICRFTGGTPELITPQIQAIFAGQNPRSVVTKALYRASAAYARDMREIRFWIPYGDGSLAMNCVLAYSLNSGGAYLWYPDTVQGIGCSAMKVVGTNAGETLLAGVDGFLAAFTASAASDDGQPIQTSWASSEIMLGGGIDYGVIARLDHVYLTYARNGAEPDEYEPPTAAEAAVVAEMSWKKTLTYRRTVPLTVEANGGTYRERRLNYAKYGRSVIVGMEHRSRTAGLNIVQALVEADVIQGAEK